MKSRKHVRQLRLSLSLVMLLGLSACNTPTGALSNSDDAVLVIQANIQAGQTGRSVQIQADQLPQDLRQSREISVALDNSNNILTVKRNADQSLSFALSDAVKVDSNGNLKVLLIADQKKSFFVTLKTGSLLELDAQAIQVSPSTQVLKGSQIQLQASLKQAELADGVDFSWYTGSTANGPWVSIPGSGPQTEWDTPQAGAYFVRLDMQKKDSPLSSSYITSSALITVKESDDAIATDPQSGDILQGAAIQLKINPSALKLPTAGLSYRWAYAQSPQGPFIPIEEQGAEISWEPPAAGAYYIRSEWRQDQKLRASYVPSKAIVKVANSNQFLKITPQAGEVTRGDVVEIQSNLENTSPGLDYSWFYSLSPQGPFNLIEGQGEQVSWYPEQTGQFYLRMKTLDSAAGISRTYTSSKALVTATDSNQFFSVSPSNGQIPKGEAIQVSLNRDLERVVWSYSNSPQAPFVIIPGMGKSIQWVPAQAGSYYLRAQGINSAAKNVTFSTATAQVFVSERDDIIVTEPALANLNLGSIVNLKANLPAQSNQSKYFWSYGTTANGPWTSIASLDSRFSQKNIRWIPTQTGNFFVKVDVNNPDSQSTVSFVSPSPVVFVDQQTPFFKTNPEPAFIGTEGAVTLTTSFQPAGLSLSYAWSYGPSTAGPFYAIGGTTLPEILWRKPGQVGSYYIKMDATLKDSSQVLSFVSKNPLVFVSSGTQSQPSFGTSSLSQ